MVLVVEIIVDLVQHGLPPSELAELGLAPSEVGDPALPPSEVGKILILVVVEGE